MAQVDSGATQQVVGQLPMMKVLKWILVLPAAIVAMLVVQLICGFFAYIFGDSFPLNLIGTRLIGELFAGVVASRLFVAVGSSVAPSHKFAVACGLAGIVIVFALWSIFTIMSMPGFSFGATVVWPAPFGLRPHTSPTWWQLLIDVMWGLSALVAVLVVREQRREEIAREADK